MALAEIKNRLEVTLSTRKITQALQLVAANKMKSYQRMAVSSRSYARELTQALQLVSGEDHESPLFLKRTEGASLFVLVTSNKGLCGTLNAKLVQHLWKSEEWNALAPEERLLATIGKKGKDAARRAGVSVLMDFPDVKEKMAPLEALDIAEKILAYWQANPVQRVYIVAPEYVSPFESRPQVTTYLPLSESFLDGNAATSLPMVYAEPNLDRVIEQLSLQIIEAFLTHSFYELKASEYSSRMVAMKKASDAAEEMTTALRLEYNKTRQSIITAQLAELAGASEAMEVK